MTAVLFFIAAIFALSGAIGVVLLRNPFYSVLALVVHLIALALLFLLLEAQFVAAVQVVVYAGAVMVLYVFVVAYIGGADQPLGTGGGPLRTLGPIFALAVAIELCIAMLGSALRGVSSKGARAAVPVRDTAPDRTAFLDHVPVPVRGRVAAADGRRGRRGRAGSPASRAGSDRGAGGVRPAAARGPAPGLHRDDGRDHRRAPGDLGGFAGGEQTEPEPAGTGGGRPEGGW